MNSCNCGGGIVKLQDGDGLLSMGEVMTMSEQHLIIIRGNSGSGKTTVANALRSAMREKFGKGGTMLVSQDAIRIDILDVKDTSDNDSIALIYDICMYGMKLKKNVILEGILDRWKYGEILLKLISEWQGQTHIYYYNIPLDVTLNRHEMRPQKELFSKDHMRSWYNSDNCLNIPGERIITEDVSLGEAIVMIQKDCDERDRTR